jgi:hypothetical protein
MPPDKRVQELRLGGAGDSADDAELSRFGAEFQERHRQHVELVEKQQRSPPELPLEEQENILSLMQAKQKLAEAIADRRAATVVGLQVKAAVLLAYCQYDVDGQLHWTDHDELMGWSIARDLLGDEAARPL